MEKTMGKITRIKDALEYAGREVSIRGWIQREDPVLPVAGRLRDNAGGWR